MPKQIIVSPAGDRLVVLSEADYDTLVEAADDVADAGAIQAFRHEIATGSEELIPSEVVDRFLGGENRLKVWREYRGMSSKALADMAGIAQPFLSQIETGKRVGTIETLQKLAEVLNVTRDDLIASQPHTRPIHVRVEDILAAGPGLTIADIAARLDVSESNVRASCDWLVKQKRLEKSGQPGRYRKRAV